jgi:hypothetical protein
MTGLHGCRKDEGLGWGARLSFFTGGKGGNGDRGMIFEVGIARRREGQMLCTEDVLDACPGFPRAFLLDDF